LFDIRKIYGMEVLRILDLLIIFLDPLGQKQKLAKLTGYFVLQVSQLKWQAQKGYT
jgi:hypothetical protein